MSKLIYAASPRSAYMLYATGFHAPDAFLFLEQRGRKTIVLNDLEIDRGRREAKVDEVLAASDLARDFGSHSPALIAAGLLLRRKIRRVEVLRAAKIVRSGLLEWQGQPLTSEVVRAEADSTVLRAGGIPEGTIVAGGRQACDPHERGHGRLRAHELIILDIFPRDARSGYFGYLTRTVVRGRANEAQRQLWETVCAAQRRAIRAIKPRAKGAAVHKAVQEFFVARGYPTERRDGRCTGFFHGTGHGLGLDLHEEPRLGVTVFRKGQVFTVEPGLYYPEIGGARHEDVVTVTATGCRLLSRLRVPLEL